MDTTKLAMTHQESTNSHDGSLLPSLRQVKLLAMLQDTGSLKLSDVMKTFGVARATAQRDIDRLCLQDGVERTRGGAIFIRPDKTAQAILHEKREHDSPSAKSYIAQIAVELLRGSATLYLDSGTTNISLAHALVLADWRPVWVVTNSWHIAEILSQAQIRHELLGGEVDARSLAISGPTAIETVSRFHFDWAVLSADAITEQGSIRVSRPPEAQLKRTALHAGTRKMLVAHAEKYACDAHVEAVNLAEFDYWITDEADERMIALANSYDVQLVDHVSSSLKTNTGNGNM
ncbi:MAG TPA: DeoR/GlpR family DNA-binding transcription regulator [Armatimonadota bacterium]|nr:DeoR/GlpR family DNA-binding transcription regulator [Armatimonadota bacterium]